MKKNRGCNLCCLGGGSVEVETQSTIKWSIMASCLAVKAAVSGLRSGSLSGQEATGPGSRVSPRHPLIQEKRACNRSKRELGAK